MSSTISTVASGSLGFTNAGSTYDVAQLGDGTIVGTKDGRLWGGCSAM